VTCCFRDSGLQIPEKTSYIHEIRLSLQYRAFRNLVTGSGSWLRVLAAVEAAADHSPPTSAEVKKMWIYTSAPPYAFMA
jgi:hypothetical protein